MCKHIRKVKEKILGNLFKDQRFHNSIISNLPANSKGYLDDFKQEVFMILLKKPEDLIVGLEESGGLYWYALRVVMTQAKKPNSEFNKKYMERSRTEESCHLFLFLEDVNEEYREFDVLKYIQENRILGWYETDMLSAYFKLGMYKHDNEKKTYRGMEDKYGIDHVAICLTVNNAIKKIKEHVRKNRVSI